MPKGWNLRRQAWARLRASATRETLGAQAVASLSSAPFDGTSLNETEFRYPVPPEEISRIKASYESDVAVSKNELRPIFATCLEECNSAPTKCDKHKPQYVKIMRALYTGGSWVLYRPANFVATIHKMFDENVDPKYITERVTRELRSHNRDSVCTISADDEGAIRQLKLDARAMYDNHKIPEEKIAAFMRDKLEEIIRLKSTSEQAYLREIYETHPDDPKVLEIVKRELCTPRSTDSERLEGFRAKWEALIKNGHTWTNVHKIMLADVAELNEAEREQEEILFAQIALEKEKAREEAEKQEEARKAQRAHVTKQLLSSKHSGTCAGCLKNAVPEHLTGAVLQCRVCKGLVERGLQANESYYCSRKCARENGEKHMLEKHPCTAGDDCINPDRHAFETFTQYCPECWDEWGIISYICKMPCYDKNWVAHWKKTHARLEREFIERLEKEKSITELEEESESRVKGKGKEVVVASDSSAETPVDYDMTDA